MKLFNKYKKLIASLILLTLVFINGCNLKELFKFDLMPKVEKVTGVEVKDVFSPLKETFKGATFSNAPNIKQRDVITNRNTIIKAGQYINGLNPLYLLITIGISILIISKLILSKSANVSALRVVMENIEKDDNDRVKKNIKLDTLRNRKVSKIIEPIVYKLNQNKYNKS